MDRYYHSSTVTYRSACPVKVEHPSKDRLSAVRRKSNITGFPVIGRDISYGFFSEWRSIVELIALKRPHDYPTEFGLP